MGLTVSWNREPLGRTREGPTGFLAMRVLAFSEAKESSKTVGSNKVGCFVVGLRSPCGLARLRFLIEIVLNVVAMLASMARATDQCRWSVMQLTVRGANRGDIEIATEWVTANVGFGLSFLVNAVRGHGISLLRRRRIARYRSAVASFLAGARTAPDAFRGNVGTRAGWSSVPPPPLPPPSPLFFFR